MTGATRKRMRKTLGNGSRARTPGATGLSNVGNTDKEDSTRQDRRLGVATIRFGLEEKEWGDWGLYPNVILNLSSQ